MKVLMSAASQAILEIVIRTEFDVIASRLRARQIAAACGFGTLDQARIGTVVSELARNIFNYAGSGSVQFSVAGTDLAQHLQIDLVDQGPGIADLDTILAGLYRSRTGMGLGILSARRLMDRCDITTGTQGTRISIAKRFPTNAARLSAAMLETIVAELDDLPQGPALSVAQGQNRELSDALVALQARQDELELATTRLEDTNRRVEALNALLDDKAAALQQADRSKDEFLAILSHELRGPLSAAGMAARLLQEPAVTPGRAAQMGQLITRQVVHMSTIVEDLLDVSRVSRGLVTIVREPVELAHVASAALEQLGAAAERKQHSIELRPPTLPLTVLGDFTRLVQVLGNLLTNAIRYTPDHGVIRIVLEAHGPFAVIKVSDNGQGIDAELLPRLFDLYVQAERSADRTGGGLGLGLALVKSLVEAHGGTITASSEGRGQGSVFTVRLPLHRERRGE